MLKISPVNIASDLPVQVTGTDLTFQSASSASPFADFLRRAQTAAEMIEGWASNLDAILGEFRDAPPEVWDAAADAMTVLEIANIDVQDAVYELDAAIHRAR